MRRIILPLLALPLVGVLLLGVAAVRDPRWIVAQGHIFGGAATPEVAVRAMMQVQANGLRDFRILDDRWVGLRRVVVFSYGVQVPGEPVHGEFGYALAEMRRGWSAIPGSLHADAPPPNLVTFSTAFVDDMTLVYGKALVPNLDHVEAVFADHVSEVAIVNGGFLLSEPHAQPLVGLRVIDQHGQVVQDVAQPELMAAARWQ